MLEIPQYGLRAYALLYSKYSLKERFEQSCLDWIVSPSMRKKIFAVLLKAGWIKKISWQEYQCVDPDMIFQHLLDFKVPEIIKETKKPYAFTGLSAIEIWSDYSYIQRGKEKSPYFMKVLKKDMRYWKDFFNMKGIPYYVKHGSTIGEYIILIPVEKISIAEKEGISVEPLKITMQEAKKNEMFQYAYQYMKKKHGEG